MSGLLPMPITFSFSRMKADSGIGVCLRGGKNLPYVCIFIRCQEIKGDFVQLNIMLHGLCQIAFIIGVLLLIDLSNVA